MKHVRSERGLTLVEIMVVLIILSVLVGMLTKGLFKSGDAAKARLNGLKMQKVQNYINQYQLQYNRLPPSLASLLNCDEITGPGCVPIANDESELYDVWDRPMKYRLEGGGRSYALTSTGADMKDGGSGVEGDITITGP